MIYLRAFKVAWNTFWFAVRHERAHLHWQQVYNLATDHRINALIKQSRQCQQGRS